MPDVMRTSVLHGPRIGAQGVISTGCAAVIFDASRTRLLLTRRTDNGEWCLPRSSANKWEFRR